MGEWGGGVGGGGWGLGPMPEPPNPNPQKIYLNTILYLFNLVLLNYFFMNNFFCKLNYIFQKIKK